MMKIVTAKLVTGLLKHSREEIPSKIQVGDISGIN